MSPPLAPERGAGAAAVPPARRAPGRAGSALRAPAALAAAIAALLLVMNALAQDNFFVSYVVASNLTAFLPLMIIAAGQAWVVLGGSIDLSLGAIVSLVNVVVVQLVEAWGGSGVAMLAAMFAGVVVGAACGAVNGAIIAGFRVQAIVTTFATGVVFGGLALRILPQAGGALPSAYYSVYAASHAGLPFVAWMLILLVALVFVVGRTRFAAHLVALGGNAQSAYQSGLPVARVRIVSHALGGAAAALAALAILGVAGAGDPLMGQAFTLSSVSAVVVGGVALAGGWGSVWGALLGALILGLINNLIFFAGIDYVYQSVVQGTIILLALAGGVLTSRRPQ